MSNAAVDPSSELTIKNLKEAVCREWGANEENGEEIRGRWRGQPGGGGN
jgi:hypothetical protein